MLAVVGRCGVIAGRPVVMLLRPRMSPPAVAAWVEGHACLPGLVGAKAAALAVGLSMLCLRGQVLERSLASTACMSQTQPPSPGLMMAVRM